MSTNQVPDIGEMYEFWQMKANILSLLNYSLGTARNDYEMSAFAQVIEDIESLGNINKEEI